jgi:hypothetical protein
VHALDGDERLLAKFVAVWIPEHDDGKRGASARIVDYFLDYTPDVPFALSKIEGPKLCWVLVVMSMGLEDGV